MNKTKIKASKIRSLHEKNVRILLLSSRMIHLHKHVDVLTCHTPSLLNHEEKSLSAYKYASRRILASSQEKK